MHIYIYTHIHIYIYTHIHIYIHTTADLPPQLGYTYGYLPGIITGSATSSLL